MDHGVRGALVNVNRGLISWLLILLVDNRREDSRDEKHNDVGNSQAPGSLYQVAVVRLIPQIVVVVLLLEGATGNLTSINDIYGLLLIRGHRAALVVRDVGSCSNSSNKRWDRSASVVRVCQSMSEETYQP